MASLLATETILKYSTSLNFLQNAHNHLVYKLFYS